VEHICVLALPLTTYFHLFHHVRAVVVEIWLLDCEGMQVILLSLVAPFPCRAAELTELQHRHTDLTSSLPVFVWHQVRRWPSTKQLLIMIKLDKFIRKSTSVLLFFLATSFYRGFRRQVAHKILRNQLITS
jgi:hypothetical protein